jgi:hypothetical protein
MSKGVVDMIANIATARRNIAISTSMRVKPCTAFGFKKNLFAGLLISIFVFNFVFMAISLQ